jgi:hypothetical protein
MAAKNASRRTPAFLAPPLLLKTAAMVIPASCATLKNAVEKEGSRAVEKALLAHASEPWPRVQKVPRLWLQPGSYS